MFILSLVKTSTIVNVSAETISPISVTFSLKPPAIIMEKIRSEKKYDFQYLFTFVHVTKIP